jgi:hypothetical protein
MNLKKIVLLFSLLLITMLLIENVSADAGTTYYQYRIETRGQVSSGVNWKHTTTATAQDYYGESFYVASRTLLEYAGIPPYEYDSYQAYSYIYQFKENTSWQDHSHQSLNGWLNKGN